MREEARCTVFNGALASFVVIGVLLVWTGARLLLPGVSAVACDSSKGLLSLALVPLAFVCLLRRQAVPCSLSLLVAAAFLNIVPERMTDVPSTAGSLACAVGISACACIFLTDGRIAPGSAALASAASLVMAPIGFPSWIAGSVMMASGFAFIGMGTAGFVAGLDDARNHGIGTSRKNAPAAAGLLVAGTLGASLAICTDCSESPSFFLVLPSALIAISLIALNDGRVLTGSALMSFGMHCILLLMAEWSDGFPASAAVFCLPLVACGLLLSGRNPVPGCCLAASGALSLASIVLDAECLRSIAGAIICIGGIASASMIASGRPLFDSEGVPKELEGLAQVPVAGGFVLSCLMLTLCASMELLSSNDDSADIAVLCCSLLAISLSVAAAGSRAVTESVVLLLSGISAMIFSVADMASSTDGLLLVSAFMTVGLGTGAFISIRRGDVIRGTAAIAAASGFLLLPAGADAAAHALLLISGLLFLGSGIRKAYVFGTRHEAKVSRRCNLTQNGSDYSAFLAKSMGVLLIAILTLMYGINTVGYEQRAGLEMTRVVLCVVLMCFGTYSVYNGISSAGAFMFMTATYGLVSSVMNLTGTGAPGAFQQLVALSFVPVVWSTFRNRETVLFLISILMFAAFVLNPITGGGAAFTVADMMLKAVSCASAVTLWIAYDTGHVDASALRGPPRDPLRTIGSLTFMLCGLCCIWIGISDILGIGDDAAIPCAVLSVSAIAFSLCLIGKGAAVSGVCALSAASACLACGWTGGPDIASIGLVALSLAWAIGHRIIRDSAFSVACLLPLILHASGLPVAGDALFAIAGSSILIASCANLAGLGYGSPIAGDRVDAGLIVSSAIGVFAACSMLIEPSAPAAALSSVSMGFALYSVLRGREPEGLYMMSMAVPCMGSWLLHLAGAADEEPFLAISLVLAAAGASFIVRRETILAASCMVCCIAFAAFLLTEDAVACSIGGTAYFIGTAVHVLVRNSRRRGSVATAEAIRF